jgi:hypothetical protein
LVRQVWVSTLDEARELENGRLACVDNAVPAEGPLCLLLTEATEGQFAFGAGVLAGDRLAARIGSSAAGGAAGTLQPCRGKVCRSSAHEQRNTQELPWQLHDDALGRAPGGRATRVVFGQATAARRVEDVRGGSETLRFG